MSVSLTLSCATLVQHEKFQSAPGSRVGTPAYLAPEVIMTTKGTTYDGKVRLRLPDAPSQLPCIRVLHQQQHATPDHYVLQQWYHIPVMIQTLFRSTLPARCIDSKLAALSGCSCSCIGSTDAD